MNDADYWKDLARQNHQAAVTANERAAKAETELTELRANINAGVKHYDALARSALDKGCQSDARLFDTFARHIAGLLRRQGIGGAS